MFPCQTLASNSKLRGLLAQNTFEQAEYRKRTLAIQRELRAVAVTLGASRRRFLERRAQLARKQSTTHHRSGINAAATMEGKRRAEADRGGNVGFRTLSAVVERPCDEENERNAEPDLGADYRHEWHEHRGKKDPSRGGSVKKRSKQPQSKKHRQYVSETTMTTAETGQETANPTSGIHHKNHPSKYEQEPKHTAVSHSERHPKMDDGHSVAEKIPTKTSKEDGDLETSHRGKLVKRSSTLHPIAPAPKPSDAAALWNESTYITRRMRGMTVGATEQLDLSRLRQIYDVHIGLDSPDGEQEYLENTQQRIKDFLERASSESVVSDSSDLASEAGSASTLTRRASDRRRSVNRVYALEPSPRLRKRSVPNNKPAEAAISEEGEGFKDKLRLPPLSLPPVYSNVPMKLLPRSYTNKRGHHQRESGRILTAEEWEDLKHCRYLRHKSIP